MTCGVLTPGSLSRTVKPYRMESDRERERVPEAAEPLSSGLLTALTDLGRNSANAIAGAVSGSAYRWVCSGWRMAVAGNCV